PSDPFHSQRGLSRLAFAFFRIHIYKLDPSHVPLPIPHISLLLKMRITPPSASPQPAGPSSHSVPNDRLDIDSRFVSGIALAVRGGVANTVRISQATNEDIMRDQQDAALHGYTIYPDTITIKTRVYSATKEMARFVSITAGMQEIDGKFVVVIDTPKSVQSWLALPAAAILSSAGASSSFQIDVAIVLPPSLSSLISLEIEAHAGSVEIGDIGNVNIVDQMKIECRNGGVSSKSCTAANIHITTLTGSIRGRFTASSNFLCKTLSAAIDVQLAVSPCPDAVHVESTSGAIRGAFYASREFAAKTFSGTIDIVVKGAPAAITLSNVSGTTMGTFQVKERFEAASVSGNIKVNIETVTKQACECNIKTISGCAVMCLLSLFTGQFKLTSFSSHATLLSRHHPSKRYPFVLEVQHPNRKLGFAGHVPTLSPPPPVHPMVDLDHWEGDMDHPILQAGQGEDTAQSKVVMEAVSGDVQLVLLGA
ncbi:hypothetical protein BC937DRAFT_94477, partial [Endogone sp. FLAS-F59071]